MMFDPASMIDPTVFPAGVGCDDCDTTVTIELSDLEGLPSHVSSTTQAIDCHLGHLGWDVDMIEKYVHCPECAAH